MQDLRNLLTLWFRFDVRQVSTPHGDGFRIGSDVNQGQFESLCHLAKVHDARVVYTDLEYDGQGRGLYVLVKSDEEEDGRSN
jgi:hypothetical protein